MGRKGPKLQLSIINKVFIFSLLIGAVTAQLKDGLYQILGPGLESYKYARSDDHIISYCPEL